MHQIEILKRTSSVAISKPKVNISGKLDHFTNDASLPTVLTRMTVCGGLCLTFLSLHPIKENLAALGHALPKSGNGIR